MLKDYKITVTFPRDDYLRCKSSTERDAYILTAAKREFDKVNQISKRQEGTTQRPDNSDRTTQTVHDEETTPPEHNRGRDDATVNSRPAQQETVDARRERIARAVAAEIKRQRRQKKKKKREQPKSKSEAVHEYCLRAIANYKAPESYPPATTAVTFDPSLPATQQSNGGDGCKKLPREVRERYKASKMWWSKSERREFERDSESQAVVAEYRASVARDTTSVVVPRRKFLCGQPVAEDTQSTTTNAKNTSATEPLIMTPAELERVGELKWTKVEKGARSEPDQELCKLKPATRLTSLPC